MTHVSSFEGSPVLPLLLSPSEPPVLSSPLSLPDRGLPVVVEGEPLELSAIPDVSVAGPDVAVAGPDVEGSTGPDELGSELAVPPPSPPPSVVWEAMSGPQLQPAHKKRNAPPSFRTSIVERISESGADHRG